MKQNKQYKAILTAEYMLYKHIDKYGYIYIAIAIALTITNLLTY